MLVTVAEAAGGGGGGGGGGSLCRKREATRAITTSAAQAARPMPSSVFGDMPFLRGAGIGPRYRRRRQPATLCPTTCLFTHIDDRAHDPANMEDTRVSTRATRANRFGAGADGRDGRGARPG